MSEEEQKYFKGLIGFTFDSDDIKYIEKVVDKKDKEIERLNKQIEEYQKALDETTSEKVNLHSIINKIRNYVYKSIDKEWDDILCIIEDGLRK